MFSPSCRGKIHLEYLSHRWWKYKREYFFGPIFLIKKGPLFREYYEKEKKSREILLTLLPKNYRYKRYKTKKELEMIKKEIED